MMACSDEKIIEPETEKHRALHEGIRVGWRDEVVITGGTDMSLVSSSSRVGTMTAATGSAAKRIGQPSC